MFYLREAIVKEIIGRVNGITEIKVEAEKQTRPALNYEDFTGPVSSGDNVILNVTANELKLGSGGYDLVYFNEKNGIMDAKSKGHIIKGRYTPWQFPILSIEEQKSPYHELFKQKLRLEGLPVAVGELHSQLAPFCLTLKYLKPKTKITYIMTDGAALPFMLSRAVKELVDQKVINKTITYGHAFGADIEAVNIFSALASAKHICKADVVIAVMGPGITGTGSELGFTGMEQGQILNAVHAMGGRPVAITRVSFADKRSRHRGISHHTVASLSIGCQVKADMPLPKLQADYSERVKRQLEKTGLDLVQETSFYDSTVTLDLISKQMPWVTTMGRSIKDDKEFFLAAGAAAYKVAEYL